MTAEQRLRAVTDLGFTECQARFLVTVMLHAGVCVPRQYARFAGTAYGHNVTKFFDKLTERGYATASDCLHNRAALYHVHHQALYRAIGQAQSRYRRPVSARQTIDRVRLLDSVITNPELVWLPTEEEKVAFFNLMAPSLPPERLPHITVGKTSAGRLHLFPDGLPIGVGSNGRVVFLYLVTSPFDTDLRRFLQRHADLLRALPGWTLQLLFVRRAAGMMSAFENVAREELTGRFSPTTLTELKWYCEERRSVSDLRARGQSDGRFRQAHRAFATARCQMLYRRWLTDGDTVFELRRSGKRGGCLVGSANFTTAAFDGRNVEACLLLSKADDLVDELFDQRLSKRPLAFDDFGPGTDEPPESATAELPRLRIESAIVAQTNHLRVTYSHRLDPLPSSLRLTLRLPGETRPRVSAAVPRKAKVTETIALSEVALADAYGTLLATLVADVGGKLIESFPVWVIQEHQLTYEPGEGSSSSKSKIEETGEGLPEFLNELGKRDGLPAVIEYLHSIADNLGGDVALLRSTCGETNYLAEVRAALLIVQRVRYELDDSKTLVRPREVLPTTAKAVDEAISECELEEPGSKNVRLALEGYRMFSEADILLYTASSDAEGTLGGLVQAADRIPEYLREAVELGQLCANDPVCAQHQPNSAHDDRLLLGAACHGCLLLPENSCERRNDFLDRSLVVPTVDGDGAAFFDDI